MYNHIKRNNYLSSVTDVKKVHQLSVFNRMLTSLAQVRLARKIIWDRTLSTFIPSELKSYRKILFCLLGSVMLLEDIVQTDLLTKKKNPKFPSSTKQLALSVPDPGTGFLGFVATAQVQTNMDFLIFRLTIKCYFLKYVTGNILIFLIKSL